MESYTVKEYSINWKVDQEKTTRVAPSLPKEDVKCDIKHEDTLDLLQNIGFALRAAKRSIDSINQKNPDQKEDES